MSHNIEQPAQGKKVEGLDPVEKTEILQNTIKISTSEKYRITDEEEVNWLKDLHEKLKAASLFNRYASERSGDGYVTTFQTDAVARLMNEVQDRLFVALYEEDLELAQKTISEAFQVLNGAEKVNDRGAHAGGCVCEECANLAQIAEALEFKDISSGIRYGTMCPRYSTTQPTSLEDLLRHDSSDFKSAEKYKNYLDSRLTIWMNLPWAKDRLHSLYREQRGTERFEADQNPEAANYLKLVQEYNEAHSKGLRTVYFDGGSSTINAFPGNKIEMPEGELVDEKVADYLEDADMSFLDFDLGIYTQMPIGKKKSGYSSSIVTSKDFFLVPEGADEQELKTTLHNKLDELGRKVATRERYNDPRIRNSHGAAKEAALVAALLTKLGDTEGATNALSFAKETARALDSDGEGDYSSQSGEKYLAIALAENILGHDPSETLDIAEGTYMHYLGGLDSYSGISPTTRMYGLHGVAKIRVLAGQDPTATLAKLRTIDDKISSASQVATGGFEIWGKIRSKLKETKEAKGAK